VLAKIDAMLGQPAPSRVADHPPSLAKLNALRSALKKVADFIVTLPYHLETFFLTERKAGAAVRDVDTAVSSADPDAPLGDRHSVLLFSLPKDLGAVLERRTLLFLRTLQWFVAVDRGEVRAMLGDMNTTVHSLFDTELYGAHLQLTKSNSNASEGLYCFGVKMRPPVGDLAGKTKAFALNGLRSFYLERLDEIEAEAIEAQRPPDSPLEFQSIPERVPAGFTTIA
jgi:hypothetical protein